MLKGNGILHFDPENKTKKHFNQSSWKRVAIIKTNCDLDNYYVWFLKKRFNIELNKNLRGSHITIISDKLDKEIFDQTIKIFNNKPIEFFYDPSKIKTNSNHWWIPIICPDAENIRNAIGLNPKPYFDFHLTIGHTKENQIEHSKYILECIKKFNL